jgi:uncharacterized protein YdhG (YjbR/CyaY superfamily)
MSPVHATDIDAYIAGFPKEVQERLQQVRAVIREAAPKAVEAIKYDIPTFVQDGNMISFAGYKKHIGIYPAPSGDEAFEAAIAPYRASKATLRFPLDQPMPLALIKKAVAQRVKQHAAKSEKKKAAK